MTRRLLVLALLAACARGKEAADTTAALPVDTVAPAVAPMPALDSAARADSIARAESTKAAASSKTTSKTSTKRPAVSTRDTAHLGRDSAIITNPRDPRRQLPTVPTKKPPQ